MVDLKVPFNQPDKIAYFAILDLNLRVLNQGEKENITMSTSIRSPEEIRQLGLNALTHSLGSVDTIRFLQQFDRGQGDYTKERNAILGNPNLEEVLQELESKSAINQIAGRKKAE